MLEEKHWKLLREKKIKRKTEQRGQERIKLVIQKQEDDEFCDASILNIEKDHKDGKNYNNSIWNEPNDLKIKRTKPNLNMNGLDKDKLIICLRDNKKDQSQITVRILPYRQTLDE